MPYSPEDNRSYLRSRYENQRREFLSYLGGVCVRCGATEDLHIDHVDPSQKSFPLARLWSIDSMPEVYAELDKCQLLCAPHHEEKTAAEHRKAREGTFKHGTVYAWMKKKCDCAECEAAKISWSEARNASRRTGKRGPYKTSPRGGTR